MVKDKEVTKINRINLWILISFCWVFPILTIIFLPRIYQIMVPITLLFLGLFITLSPDVDKWFLYKRKYKKKKLKKQNDKKKTKKR